MSEQTTVEEQKIPSKEEVLSFLQEQIEMKKVQVELQQLNTALAVSKAEELKALSFIAQITQQKEPQGTLHTVTQEDLDNNPELAEHGVGVGDEIMVPSEEGRKLKKK